MKTATVEYGKLVGDSHLIVVDDGKTRTTTIVACEVWDQAYGNSIPEKIDSLLGWSNTEHDREYTHLID